MRDPATTPVFDVMSRQVRTVSADAKVRMALDLLVEYGISGLPVVGRGGAPVGVFSLSDLSAAEQHHGTMQEFDRALREDAERNGDPDTTAEDDGLDGEPLLENLVSEHMTPDILWVSPGATVAEAAREMVEQKVRRLLVLENDRLVGIVSATDILRAIAAD